MLKGARHEVITDISFFMNEVGQRGGVVSFASVGSGAAFDQSAALVTYKAVASGGVPAGLLLCDMVNYDLTRMKLNPYKEEVQQGSKVVFLTRGWVVTDQVASGISINPGDPAYLANGGRITNAYVNTVATPKVGRFLSTQDEDGFAKVEINLP